MLQKAEEKPIKRRRKRQPPTIMQPTHDFIKKLPHSIIYQQNQKHFGNIQLDIPNEEWITIGDFSINIDTVTKSELIAMRRYLPHEEYRLLKNRKSARLCRIKRKVERNCLQTKAMSFED